MLLFSLCIFYIISKNVFINSVLYSHILIIYPCTSTVNLTFTKWLKFKSTFGYDAKFWFIDNFTPKYNWKPIPTEETSRYKSDNKSFTYLWDNYFLFDHTFAEKQQYVTEPSKLTYT